MNLNRLQIISIKILTILIFIALFIGSCKVNKHTQIDYSNSAKKPITYIKTGFKS